MIIVNSLGFDGAVKKSWTAELLSRDGPLLTLSGVFEIDVSHSELGLIKRGTISREFYWLDRWYNVFLFHEPDGAFRNYYCNISMPPRFESNVLEYVDLDIDLLVDKAGNYTILDEDDFQANAAAHAYPDEVRKQADAAVEALKGLIARHEFPFDQ